MTTEHVDQSVIDRLFADRPSQPLAAAEFDALQRHAATCRDCRDQFERRRRQAVRGDDVLSEGQVATILNVVLERGRAMERARAAAPVESATAVAHAAHPRSKREWTPRLRWALGAGGALAAACAAILLLPQSEDRQWGRRGVPGSSPSGQFHCFDQATERADPFVTDEPTCTPGRTVSIDARSLGGFPWITVVTCDASRCSLSDSVAFDGKPTVSLQSRAIREGESITVFAIWSKKELLKSDVEDMVKTIRSRGGSPDAESALPFRQETQQLVARVRSQRSPS